MLKLMQLSTSVNEKTQRSHRREMLWQVWLPLLGGVVLAAFLCYLLIAAGNASIERGAQTAMILLAVPVIFLGIGLLVALLVLNASIGKLARWLPKQTLRAQKAAESLNSGAQKTADAVAAPFVTLESWGDAFRRLWRRRG
jgi:predicted PurR-regulated permease PerM